MSALNLQNYSQKNKKPLYTFPQPFINKEIFQKAMNMKVLGIGIVSCILLFLLILLSSCSIEETTELEEQGFEATDEEITATDSETEEILEELQVATEELEQETEEKEEEAEQVEEVEEDTDTTSEEQLVNGKTAQERLDDAYQNLHDIDSALDVRSDFPDLELVYTDDGSQDPLLPEDILPFEYMYSAEVDKTFSLCAIDRSVMICDGVLDALVTDEDINSGRCVVTSVYLESRS